jgi:PAS domain S-box-containing protein
MKRTAADRLDSVLDSITDQFFALDRRWRYTRFNKRAEALLRALGLDPANLLGRVVWDVFADVPAEAALRRAMTERVAATHEHYYPPLREWLEDRIFPRDDGGLDVFQRYLTDRKRLLRVEDQLAREEALTHAGSGAWNVVTGQVAWSRETYRIYGFDPATTTPSAALFFGIVHPDDRDRLAAQYETVVRERSDHDHEFRIVTPDGVTRYIRSVGHCVLDEAGTLIEVVGTVIDVSERRLTEARLAESEHRCRLLTGSTPDAARGAPPHDTAIGGSEDRALSRRQEEVLRETALGYANHDIATRLGISVRTVEKHKTNAMRREHMTGRRDVVRYAVDHGWFEGR